MKICIVNPSRCGSTLLLSMLANKLKNFSVFYEIISHQGGLDLLNVDANIIFKYQYLFANKSLNGADKYIIADRKNLDDWAYSSYMSFTNHHHHGKLTNKEYEYNEDDFLRHKESMLKLYKESWIPERNRLLDNGADIVWYEDIKDKYKDRKIAFGNFRLVPVWSDFHKRQGLSCTIYDC